MSAAPQDVGAEKHRVHFDVHGLLGKGGFGDVYLAVMASPTGLRQDVALKVSHTAIDQMDKAASFLRREAWVLATLRHPVLVRVLDLYDIEGRAALVMEYVPGIDLAALLREQGAIDPRPALEIAGHVAEALDTALHARDVEGRPVALEHRDIKPGNLRLTKHGTLKLLDFGLAKAVSLSQTQGALSSMQWGSVPYMCPEALFDMRAGVPGSRDVYALGATLAQLWSGRPLFGADHRKIAVQADLHEDYVANQLKALASMPRDVRLVLRAMLAFHPASRPSPAECAKLCFALADKLGGPTLRQWGRERVWQEVTAARGDWSGRTLPASPLWPHGSEDAPLANQDESPARVEAPFAFYRSRRSQFLTRMRLWKLAGIALVAGFVAGLGLVGLIRLRSAPVPDPVSAEGHAQTQSVEVPQAPAHPQLEAVQTPTAPRSQPARPRVRPPATPSAAPVPVALPKGRVRVEGGEGVAVELHRGEQKVLPGQLDAGVWDVWANFGDHFEKQQSIRVPPGGVVSLQCHRLLAYCEAK